MPTRRWYCSSDDAEERRFAVQKIRRIRGNASQGSKAVRFRRHPSLNLKAATVKELVCWDNAHEPVLTCDVPTDQLQQFLSKPMQVPTFPVQHQSVERCVKEVTAAAQQVVGHDRRDGYIRARAAHRDTMPTFASKRDML